MKMTLKQARAALKLAEKANDRAYARYTAAERAYRLAFEAKCAAEDAAFKAQNEKTEAELRVDLLTEQMLEEAK